MATRHKVGVDRSLLCTVRFWSHQNTGTWQRGATTPTLLEGVKNVLRKEPKAGAQYGWQRRFSAAEINAAVKRLERGGFVVVGGGLHKTIALTEKGGRVGCASVKLAPWTDPQYPGSALRGVRSRKRRR